MIAEKGIVPVCNPSHSHSQSCRHHQMEQIYELHGDSREYRNRPAYANFSLVRSPRSAPCVARLAAAFHLRTFDIIFITISVRGPLILPSPVSLALSLSRWWGSFCCYDCALMLAVNSQCFCWCADSMSRCFFSDRLIWLYGSTGTSKTTRTAQDSLQG